jgi:hypothetical protein
MESVAANAAARTSPVGGDRGVEIDQQQHGIANAPAEPASPRISSKTQAKQPPVANTSPRKQAEKRSAGLDGSTKHAKRKTKKSERKQSTNAKRPKRKAPKDGNTIEKRSTRTRNPIKLTNKKKKETKQTLKKSTSHLRDAMKTSTAPPQEPDFSLDQLSAQEVTDVAACVNRWCYAKDSNKLMTEDRFSVFHNLVANFVNHPSIIRHLSRCSLEANGTSTTSFALTGSEVHSASK